MALKLVLIRHGEAKSKKLGMTDFERELTEEGAEALREAFPKHLSLVEVDEGTELWTSTAIRAKQTSAIANETLGIECVREFDDLYEQDQFAFLSALSQTDATTVVAVGHIPFMEDVCARLTGVYLGFAEGAAACVEILDTESMSRVRLLWFVQGPLF